MSKPNEKTVKVLVKRRIWMGEVDAPKKVPVGSIIEITEDEYETFRDAVTKDLPKK